MLKLLWHIRNRVLKMPVFAVRTDLHVAMHGVLVQAHQYAQCALVLAAQHGVPNNWTLADCIFNRLRADIFTTSKYNRVFDAPCECQLASHGTAARYTAAEIPCTPNTHSLLVPYARIFIDKWGGQLPWLKPSEHMYRKPACLLDTTGTYKSYSLACAKSHQIDANSAGLMSHCVCPEPVMK
jgi:hypothetical protein